MLDRSSWQHHTNDVPKLGMSVRVEHDCGEGRVLKVSNGDQGYSAWCFRCGDKGFIPHPQPSLSERLARLTQQREADAKAGSNPELPSPRELDPQQWPDAARVWLYKAGLSNSDIMRAGFYWCAALGRVVLPVYDGATLVYWQARSIDGRQPKYLNPIVDRSRIVARYGAGPVLVLTEDILSAWRVARVTQAWSCLGTSVPDPVLLQIAALDKPVVIMLDPDAGGMRGRMKMRKQLIGVGVDAYIATPRRDPKFLNREETASCIQTVIPSFLPLASSSSRL